MKEPARAKSYERKKRSWGKREFVSLEGRKYKERALEGEEEEQKPRERSERQQGEKQGAHI